MKRVLLSMMFGAAFTVGVPALVTLLFAPERREMFLAHVLGWPLLVIDKLGIGPDCGNADGIPEKLQCGTIILSIDLVVFLLCLAVFSYLSHKALARVIPIKPEPTGYILFSSRQPDSE